MLKLTRPARPLEYEKKIKSIRNCCNVTKIQAHLTQTHGGQLGQQLGRSGHDGHLQKIYLIIGSSQHFKTHGNLLISIASRCSCNWSCCSLICNCCSVIWTSSRWRIVTNRCGCCGQSCCRRCRIASAIAVWAPTGAWSKIGWRNPLANRIPALVEPERAATWAQVWIENGSTGTGSWRLQNC
jgi:hypothetical protein